MRVAILDDYQAVALSCADWGRLRRDIEVAAFADHVADEDQLVARLAPFEIVCRMRERTPFPRSLLQRLPNLKLLCATGWRNEQTIDIAAAQAQGVTVSVTHSVTPPYGTVEIVWGMILSLMRGIHSEAASVQGGGWQRTLGLAVHGRALGVVGLGTLGTPIAKIGQAFGMRTLAWSPNLTQERAGRVGVESVSKMELFRQSDVVSVHMPLAERTRGLIGAADLALMKPTAYLINTSRAPIVDETALLESLQNNRIGGAGLDVFDTEPLPLNHPFRFLPNVLATPHIGYVTDDNYALFFKETVENILAFIAGKPRRVARPDGSFDSD